MEPARAVRRRHAHWRKQHEQTSRRVAGVAPGRRGVRRFAGESRWADRAGPPFRQRNKAKACGTQPPNSRGAANAGHLAGLTEVWVRPATGHEKLHKAVTVSLDERLMDRAFSSFSEGARPAAVTPRPAAYRIRVPDPARLRAVPRPCRTTSPFFRHRARRAPGSAWRQHPDGALRPFPAASAGNGRARDTSRALDAQEIAVSESCR